MSQISRRVVNMARAAGLGDGYSESLGVRGSSYKDDATGRSAAGVPDTRALEVTVNAREVYQEREGAGGAGVALIGKG